MSIRELTLGTTGRPVDCTDEDLLDIAAALVGGVAGYRSFRIAAALTPSGSTVEGVLAFGIPGVVEQWERVPAALPK